MVRWGAIVGGRVALLFAALGLGAAPGLAQTVGWAPGSAVLQGEWALSQGASRSAGVLGLAGEAAAVFSGAGTASADVSVSASVTLGRYPDGGSADPAREFVLSRPIRTRRIRVTVRDRGSVTELRLFEPGMPTYPPVLSETRSSIGVPNLALNARAVASSSYATRPPEMAVDGEVGVGSRWVPGGDGEQTLELTLERERAIGCIQLVSGWRSAAGWTNITEDFTIESWDGTQWQPIPGLTRQPHPPGQMGLVVRHGASGGYVVMHRQDTRQWVVGRRDARGGLEVLATRPAEAILESGGTYQLRAVVIGRRLLLFVDGALVLSHDGLADRSGAVGVLSAAAGNQISVANLHVQPVDGAGCAWPATIQVELDGVPLLAGFSPHRHGYEVQLPRADVEVVTVRVGLAAAGQRVVINGQPGPEHEVVVVSPGRSDVVVRVTAPDGSAGRPYTLRLMPPPPHAGFDLVFEDGFDGPTLDLERWFHRTGKRWTSTQKPEAVSLVGGNLRIELTADGDDLTTGGIISKKAFGYGYYETRARLWRGTGWHSAFWQMGVGNIIETAPPEARAPVVNELDGFESVDPDAFTVNLHHYIPGRRIQGAQKVYGDVAGGFHTYAWEWTPRVVRFFFDGRLISESVYPPPHAPQNVWLTCVAHADASRTELPGEVLFDYFRYYRRDYGETVPEGATVIGRSDKGYTESGVWADSEGSVAHTQQLGARRSDTVGSTATWSWAVPEAGEYDVFAWNPYSWEDGVVPNYDYQVQSAAGAGRVSFDAVAGGQRWVKLGRYRFSAGDPASVTLHVRADAPVRADAVMVVPAGR